LIFPESLPIKPLRRVLPAISQDGNNHSRVRVFLASAAGGAKVVDGLADSVEQRGASLRCKYRRDGTISSPN